MWHFKTPTTGEVERGRRTCQAIDDGNEVGMAGDSEQGGQSSGGSASWPRGGEEGSWPEPQAI